MEYFLHVPPGGAMEQSGRRRVSDPSGGLSQLLPASLQQRSILASDVKSCDKSHDAPVAIASVIVIYWLTLQTPVKT